jgi:hypothetical protein
MMMVHKSVNNVLTTVRHVTPLPIVHFVTRICKDLTSLQTVHAIKVTLTMEPMLNVNLVISNVKIVLVLILIIAQSALIQYH